MDKLEQLFPDEVVQVKAYKSFVNQPERIQITSQEDINDYDPETLTSYYNFRVRLPRPALNVKTLQLARASIPNAIPNIPNTETTFWYYALPIVSPGNIYEDNAGAPGALAYTFDTSGNVYNPGGVLQDGAVYFDSGNFVIGIHNYTFNLTTVKPGNVDVPCIENGDTDYWIVYTSPQLATLRSNYLRYIRLIPTYAQPELMINFTGGYNRTFQDYDDLTTELNNATTDDPLDGELSNQVVGEFKFIPNQIAFQYDQRFNKMIFTGLDQLFSYLPAASDDPIWYEASLELQTRDKANTRFDFTGVIKVVQPSTPYRDLNLRLGFNYATYPTGDNFLNMLRPIPPYIQNPPGLQNYSSYDHMAPGYIDLVYSACCHIYTDITGGSTCDSLLNKALLASIPLNTPNLGVGFHSLPLNNPLTKIAEQLYEIYIELRTDTGQPFYLGNNAIISLELILTY